MSLVKKIIFFWLPPVLWMGLIFFLSSFHKLQASPVGWQDFIVRKTAHFFEFAILYVLFYRGLKKSTNLPIWETLAMALTLTFLYAVSDEYHQTFVSGRTGKFFDIGVDSLGAVFGMIFSWKIINLLPAKIRKVLFLK